jgi:hypothetical protein
MRREPPREFLQGGRGLAAGRAQPLDGEEFFRHPGAGIPRVVNHDRHKEQHVVGKIQGALDGQAPFAAEVALAPRLGRGRDDRHEVGAGLDLVAQLGVPRLAAGEFILVEPDFEPGRCQAVAQGAGRRPVFGGVADEHRRQRRGRGVVDIP